MHQERDQCLCDGHTLQKNLAGFCSSGKIFQPVSSFDANVLCWMVNCCRVSFWNEKPVNHKAAANMVLKEILCRLRKRSYIMAEKGNQTWQ